MAFDLNGLEVLDRAESLSLLRTVPIGRIGLTLHALPVVLPVNFILDGEQLIIRTAAGTKLTAAMAGAVVAFEADQFDAVGHAGWSVLVQGTSRVLRDTAELDRVGHLPLRPWADEATDWYMAVSTEVVSGRRVRHRYQTVAQPSTVESAGAGSRGAETVPATPLDTGEDRRTRAVDMASSLFAVERDRGSSGF